MQYVASLIPITGRLYLLRKVHAFLSPCVSGARKNFKPTKGSITRVSYNSEDN